MVRCRTGRYNACGTVNTFHTSTTQLSTRLPCLSFLPASLICVHEEVGSQRSTPQTFGVWQSMTADILFLPGKRGALLFRCSLVFAACSVSLFALLACHLCPHMGTLIPLRVGISLARSHAVFVCCAHVWGGFFAWHVHFQRETSLTVIFLCVCASRRCYFLRAWI